ncbi:MAG: Hsp20/alpha crystallin family protein [Ignavibacteriaceae bacterium]|nr:Hsp20/alpha crystallin family protein [Ignavibacteriaceae bacterium]
MSLIKWNSERELLNIEKEFSRMFNLFGNRFGLSKSEEDEYGLAEWAPLTDIYEDDESYKLKVDLPGIKKDDVRISYSDGQLSISGERKQESETKNSKHHRVERTFGKYYRSFALPKKIMEEKIDAEFKDGQLVINIPKSEEAKSRQLEIKVK